VTRECTYESVGRMGVRLPARVEWETWEQFSLDGLTHDASATQLYNLVLGTLIHVDPRLDGIADRRSRVESRK